MKILKKILLITIISICVFINVSFGKTGKVLVEATRVRKEANTNSEILTVIYENEEVEILEENGEWYKIKYKDNIGYAKQSFFKVDNSDAENDNTNTQTDNQNTSVGNSDTTVPNENPQIDNISENNQNSNSEQPQENVSQNQTTISVNSNVGLRVLPSFMASIIEQIDAEKQFTKIGEMNKWVQVTDGVLIGWIPNVKVNAATSAPNKPVSQPPTPVDNNQEANNSSEVPNNQEPETKPNTTPEETTPTVTNKTGVVNVETANVRKSASQKSDIVGTLDYGDTITIIGEEEDWYKINSGSLSGFVKKTLINEKNVTSRSLLEERKDNNTIVDEIPSEGQKVAEYATKYLGTRYVLGGKNPESGFDCSGFTRYVFLNFGYSLGSTAANQNNIGKEVSKENLEPGDLILFYNEAKSKIGHTGVYISNGDFVHAANAERGVVIDNLNTSTYYKERFVTAKRIVE